MDEAFARVASGLWDRVDGPLSFRFRIQPAVAAVLGIRAGVVAVLIDIVYELIVFQRIYPFEALAVGFLLACVPHLLLRGTATRLVHLASRSRVRS